MQFLKQEIESLALETAERLRNTPEIEQGIQHKARPHFGKIIDLRAGFRAKSLFHSFSYAWQGISYASKTQRNFRIHLGISACVIVSSAYFHLASFEWALLLGMMGLVLFAELTNTAIELVVDMLTEGRFDARAKAIKDMAAGAVLITAICSTGVGISVFVPHLLKVFHI